MEMDAQIQQARAYESANALNEAKARELPYTREREAALNRQNILKSEAQTGKANAETQKTRAGLAFQTAEFMLRDPTNEQAVIGALRFAAQHLPGMNDVIAKLEPLRGTPQFGETAGRYAMSGKEQAQQQLNADKFAETQKQSAIDNAFQQGNLNVAQGRLGVSQANAAETRRYHGVMENKPASGFSMTTNPDGTASFSYGTPAKNELEKKVLSEEDTQARLDEIERSAAKPHLSKSGQERAPRCKGQVFPNYPGARSAFAGESPAVNELEQGVVGQIAKLKSTQARDAADRMMNQSRIGPLEASRVRNAIERESPEAWQGVKRAWLTSQWDKASKETLGDGAINAGPKFRKILMGDPRQREVLKTVLSPDEFKGISDLSDVLEAAGRVKPIGSDTAWNQEMQRLANEAATPAWAKFLRLLRPQDWGRLMEDAATRHNLGKNANRVVDVITSPQAMADLRALRQMSKGQARWAAATAKLFADIGLLDEKSIVRGRGAR